MLFYKDEKCYFIEMKNAIAKMKNAPVLGKNIAKKKTLSFCISQKRPAFY
jgi:hypothetical protein